MCIVQGSTTLMMSDYEDDVNDIQNCSKTVPGFSMVGAYRTLSHPNTQLVEQ